jgi:NAD(P)-dependent dehydrogenase (short-subunit alcohol dehydrogenase family)
LRGQDSDSRSRKDAFAGGAKDPDAVMNRMAVDSVPMGHPAETIDIANACLFLASDESSFVTGIELPVCSI